MLEGLFFGTIVDDGCARETTLNRPGKVTINLSLSTTADVFSGDILSFKLSVRIAAGMPGHRSGTARLWFNDGAANSRFDASMGGSASDYFLLDGFTLGTAAGAGPKKMIDVFVDRAVGGNPFKPFGMWSKTF